MTNDLTAIRAQMEALRGFTPGPWATEYDDCHFGTLSSVRGGRAAQKQGLRRELMVEVGGFQGVKAQEASTRLIAAAPEMHDTILTLCDEVEAERAKNERLRGALQRIEAASQFWSEYPEGNAAIRYAHESTRRLARAALGQEGEANAR